METTDSGEVVPQKDVIGQSDDGLSFYCSIVDSICQEENIDLAWLSNGWVGVLAKGGLEKRLFGYKSDLNPAAAAMIADDKFATFEVLQRANVPVIEHALLYRFDNHQKHALGFNSRAYVENYLSQHDHRIVIKPNDGTQGKGVCQLSDPAEIDAVMEQVFRQSYSASMCPFYEIQREYRLVMLDSEERLAYAKEKTDDWRFNLKQGAKAVKIDDQELHERLLELAQQAVRAIGLRFCSVDIIETAKQELLVMEVNSGVMIKHYVKQHPDEYGAVKEIYRDAIRKLFTETV